jgi:crotonobetainyl-CoA:carnitine CoA-transferase CaiB-like acyl-CoA transferase
VSVADRIAHRVELIAELEHRLAADSAAAWEAKFGAAGLLVGQVKDYAAVTRSPTTLEAHSITTVGDAFGVHNPALLASQPRAALTPFRECALADIEWLAAASAAD